MGRQTYSTPPYIGQLTTAASMDHYDSHFPGRLIWFDRIQGITNTSLALYPVGLRFCILFASLAEPETASCGISAAEGIDVAGWTARYAIANFFFLLEKTRDESDTPTRRGSRCHVVNHAFLHRRSKQDDDGQLGRAEPIWRRFGRWRTKSL